ncbi:hypothetical protein [Pengzhenrongella sicca]|uniref:Uncharacterized protein n=1 Tax=Pengzhenrongella sicca TaxID=2819238 RepID=A0A8A4ZJA0_9MICO|nr:hypothetical protein [Pengzhenrongella sicca]QTE30597.1 hypothetical protein J4E96_06410 [Pengzhenrongella sicca]
MATDHRALPAEDAPASGTDAPAGDTDTRPAWLRDRSAAAAPVTTTGLVVRAAVIVFGLYLIWLGAHGDPLPSGLGADDRAGQALAGLDAWVAQSVVALALGVFAVLGAATSLLASRPVGGARGAALRTRVSDRYLLILFGLLGVIFTATIVVLASLWATGVAYRNYEVDNSVPSGANYAILIGVCVILAGVGWGMVVTLVRGPARVVAAGEHLPTARLVLRPFGYLAMGVVWVALWLVIVALAAALPVALSDRKPIGLADGPFSTAAGIVDLQENPLTLILVLLLLMPFLALVFGYVVALFPLTSWPLAALSFVYVARSLRPSYAGEALSGTSYSDEAIGPPTVGGSTALSLLPMRSSWLTDVLMKAYIMGWTPSFTAIKHCFWLGIGYLVATLAFVWPVTNPVLVALFAILSLGLVGYSVAKLVAIARAIPPRSVRAYGSKAAEDATVSGPKRTRR